MLAQFGIDVPAGGLWARSDGLGDSDSHALKIGPTTSLKHLLPERSSAGAVDCSARPRNLSTEPKVKGGG